jgi:hypothetical protein
LLIWLLVTRRFRSLWVAVVSTIVLLASSWTLVDFAGLAAYPRLLSADASAFEARSHSIVSAAIQLGATVQWARLAASALAAMIAVVALRAGRWRDESWFAAAIAFGLLVSPVLWQHYLVVLFVPLAIAQPRLNRVWLLTRALWVSPVGSPASVFQIIVVLLIAATLTIAAAASTAWRRDDQYLEIVDG